MQMSYLLDLGEPGPEPKIENAMFHDQNEFSWLKLSLEPNLSLTCGTRSNMSDVSESAQNDGTGPNIDVNEAPHELSEGRQPEMLTSQSTSQLTLPQSSSTYTVDSESPEPTPVHPIRLESSRQLGSPASAFASAAIPSQPESLLEANRTTLMYAGQPSVRSSDSVPAGYPLQQDSKNGDSDGYADPFEQIEYEGGKSADASPHNRDETKRGSWEDWCGKVHPVLEDLPCLPDLPEGDRDKAVKDAYNESLRNLPSTSKRYYGIPLDTVIDGQMNICLDPMDDESQVHYLRQKLRWSSTVKDFKFSHIDNIGSPRRPLSRENTPYVEDLAQLSEELGGTEGHACDGADELEEKVSRM